MGGGTCSISYQWFGEIYLGCTFSGSHDIATSGVSLGECAHVTWYTRLIYGQAEGAGEAGRGPHSNSDSVSTCELRISPSPPPHTHTHTTVPARAHGKEPLATRVIVVISRPLSAFMGPLINCIWFCFGKELHNLMGGTSILCSGPS